MTAPVTPAPPCDHPDAWVPEAVLFGGTAPARVDVVCFSCGWQGRVPLSAMPVTGGPDA